MVITERDQNLFKMLSSYGMLTTSQVRTHLFNCIATTTVLRRLRQLEKGHFIQRIIGLESGEHLWGVTLKGAQKIGGELLKRNWNRNFLDHDYKLVCLRLTLENAGIAHNWSPEHEIRSSVFRKYGIEKGKKEIIPDGIMHTALNNIKQAVAVELELTLKNKGKLHEVISRYSFKKEISSIWYVASSKGILRSVLKMWKKEKRITTNTELYGSLYEDVLKNPGEALAYSLSHTVRVKDIWKPCPAQMAAQGVSTLAKNSNSHCPQENGEKPMIQS